MKKLVVVLIISMCFGLFLSNGVFAVKPVKTPKPTPEPTPEPTPVEETWDFVDDFSQGEKPEWDWAILEQIKYLFPNPGECDVEGKYLREFVTVTDENPNNTCLLLRNCTLDLSNLNYPSSNYIISVDLNLIEAFDDPYDGEDDSRAQICFRKTLFAENYPTYDYCNISSRNFYDQYIFDFLPNELCIFDVNGNPLYGYLLFSYFYHIEPQEYGARLPRKLEPISRSRCCGIEVDKWYNIEIEVNRSLFTISLNGTGLIKARDKRLTEGFISLEACDSAVLFDNFKVRFLR